MRFWEGGALLDVLIALSALGCAHAARRLVPAIGKLAVPDAMWAGVALMLLGSSGLGWVPVNPETLESVVYHALALVFLAIGLRAPGPKATRSARGVAVAVPFISAVQAAVGLGVALAIGLHPATGVLLPYAFEQGPGQALSIGVAWEDSAGLVDGGQIGLIMAAVGFGWCFLLGVPLVLLGRRLGWERLGAAPPGARSAMTADPALHAEPGGGLEPLTVQIAFGGGLYLLTWVALLGLARLLSFNEHLAAMVWGFHFVVAMLLAIGARKLLVDVAGRHDVLDDGLLTRIAGAVVDIATVCALGAVRLDIAAEHAVPIVLITSLGTLFTALVCIWAARRAFPHDPFGHLLALFGTATGTLPTGLALLRAHDPELTGPAASNMVLGSAASIPLAAPLYMVLLPYAALGQGPDQAPHAWLGLLLLVVSVVALVLLWRLWGGMRPASPWWALWPQPREDEAS